MRTVGQSSFALVLSLSWALAPGALAEDRLPGGEEIYRTRCASCHGASGEGVSDEYGKPLAGDRPLAELADLIAETMPQDDPEACVGEDARKVAAFIYEAFYSKAAQARNSRPRIELSRLTVRQYQNAVADLLGSFAPGGRWDAQRGLAGEYFDDRRIRGDKRVLERRDANVAFIFGQSSPLPGKIKSEEFAIRWQGGVLAADTGEYEFIVRTENGARLWVNDSSGPLIDAWVKSGDQTEYRGSIRLLGGRVYPLVLEFFKSKEPSASVALWWKRPGQVEQVVDQRWLSPQRFPSVFVLHTPFPPDDRSAGYERGAAISKQWDQAATYAAVEVAGYVAANLPKLAGYREGAADAARRLREFCHRFAERAFRRPLSEEERRFFVERQFDAAARPESAVKAVVLLVLKSPRFLYREIGGGRSSYDVAARISFGLWDSLPDDELLKAAAGGQLETPEQVAGQARRMLGDLRTRSKLREFLHQWLRLDQADDIAKDRQLFPDFDEAIVSDLRDSLDLFLDEEVWSQRSDFRRLLLADYVYLNGRLAGFYGVDLPADAAFQRVALDSGQRAGVVSHPLLLSALAYYSTSSPIHRGVFVVRSLLGRGLRPPPEAVAPLSPDLHPDLTTRQRVALQTSPSACQTCHGIVNPLGFALENFDAVGRYRAEEKGQPIDAGGRYRTLSGATVDFTGPRELAEFLAASDEVHAAFVEQLFHHVVKQPVAAFGHRLHETLLAGFAGSEYRIQELLIDMIRATATNADTGK